MQIVNTLLQFTLRLAELFIKSAIQFVAALLKLIVNLISSRAQRPARSRHSGPRPRRRRSGRR